MRLPTPHGLTLIAESILYPPRSIFTITAGFFVRVALSGFILDGRAIDIIFSVGLANLETRNITPQLRKRTPFEEANFLAPSGSPIAPVAPVSTSRLRSAKA